MREMAAIEALKSEKADKEVRVKVLCVIVNVHSLTHPHIVFRVVFSENCSS
jgi:hypothetical protein